MYVYIYFVTASKRLSDNGVKFKTREGKESAIWFVGGGRVL